MLVHAGTDTHRSYGGQMAYTLISPSSIRPSPTRTVKLDSESVIIGHHL